jgi:hypothetical protein
VPRTLVYIDTPSPEPRHREAAGPEAAFRQARVPAVEAGEEGSRVQTVIIGTPADELGRESGEHSSEKDSGGPSSPVPQAHRDWQVVREKYEAAKASRDSAVPQSLTIEVVPAMDPDATSYEPALADLVGEGAAERLGSEGYGTVAAAKALGEDVQEIKGVGPKKYEALQDF